MKEREREVTMLPHEILGRKYVLTEVLGFVIA